MRKTIFALTFSFFTLHSISQQMVLDTTFDADGILIGNLRPRPGEDIYAQSIIPVADGKIITVAYGAAVRNGSERGCVLARYNADGSLDKTFGQGGKQNHPFNIEKLMVMPDGKLLGRSYTGLARFNTDGTLDNTFGNNGRLEVKQIFNSAIRPDGKILVVVHEEKRKLKLLCYTTNGTLETGFGTDGFASIDIPVEQFSVRNLEMFSLANNTTGLMISVRKDNKYSSRLVPAIYFVKFLANGTIHPDGVITISGLKNITHVVLQNDKLLAAGTCTNVLGENVYGLMRISLNGITDTTFGNRGLELMGRTGDCWDCVARIGVQADNKMVVAATSFIFSDHDVVLYRFTADGKRDGTLGGNSAMISVATPDIFHSLVILQDGKILLAGKFEEKRQEQNGSDYDNFAIVRFTPFVPVTKKPNPDKKRPR